MSLQVQLIYFFRMEYEEKRSSQQATKSHGQVHDALMQQKRNGNIPGIIGRLGDLGGIDKKYDCAVSTCGAGGLDTILGIRTSYLPFLTINDSLLVIP